MSSLTNFQRMNNEPLKSKVLSYELMYDNELYLAEAKIKKCLKAMDIIYKNHCDLMADTEAKLICLNLKSFVPDPSRDDAKVPEQDLADLRTALGDKESEIKKLKSELKDQFRLYQQQMADKVVEGIDLRRAGRDLNIRLANTQRKVKSSKRRMFREITQRIALTRSINLLQQTNESLEVKSRTSKLECESFKRKYNDLQDRFESSQSEYNFLKKRFDDSQVEYDSLRSKHDSLRREHDDSQLEFRELEEAHQNSELEHRKREEELEGSIAELKEALNLSNVRFQELTAGVNDDRAKASGLEVALRRQSKELKKTKVNFKNQISQLKSSLKRKAEGFCELQMVIEEAKFAVNTRDQRISDLEVALRKTAEELSQARAEVEVVKGLTGPPLESAGEQIPQFNQEGDNTVTDCEGDSTMLGVPVVDTDELNEEMADAPSRPSTPFGASPMAGIESSEPVQSGESPVTYSFASGSSSQAAFGSSIQQSKAATVAAASGTQSVAASHPLFGLSAPSACASQAPHNLYTSPALPLPFNQIRPSPANLVAPFPSLAAPPNVVDPTSSLPAPTSSPLSSPPYYPPPAATPMVPPTPGPGVPFISATPPIVPPTPRMGVPSISGIARQPTSKAGPRLALANWGSSEASSSRSAERPSPSTLAIHPDPQPGTPAASSNNPEPMAITPNKAKERVDDLLLELDSKLLASKALSKFHKGNREMLQQGLDLHTITCAGQLGDYTMELLRKSYGFICEALEKPLTEADLQLGDFNFLKFCLSNHSRVIM